MSSKELQEQEIVEEIAENTLSRVAQASSSAKSALKWGFVVEGACWAYTVYDSNKKLKNMEITPQQHRKTVIKCTGGATGSLGGGALGSFIGNLYFLVLAPSLVDLWRSGW